MQGGKNWFLPKEMNANRFFWDSHWLEIWSNHFYPSMGPNGGSVAMDSEDFCPNYLQEFGLCKQFYPFLSFYFLDVMQPVSQNPQVLPTVLTEERWPIMEHHTTSTLSCTMESIRK
jgi:hypothetical protein